MRTFMAGKKANEPELELGADDKVGVAAFFERPSLVMFGLGFAAADFIVTPADELVFLEINAGGEWYWLDEGASDRPGFPIADAIAGWLARAAGVVTKP